MAKILLTGMTAPQASKNANIRNLSFAGVIEKVLTSVGHDVVWEDPKLDITEKELESYDSVLVGVGPITSLGANRVYGALNIIDILWKSDKLSLFIDAPKTIQIGSSLKSVNASPTSLIKDFYSYRKGYSAVVSDIALSSRISSAAAKLMDMEWPTTLYPTLPWKSVNTLGVSKLVPGVSSNLVGINLDSYLIDDTEMINRSKLSQWAADSDSGPYIEKLAKTLVKPIVPMKWNKGCTDIQAYEQIFKSMGTIIAPHRGDDSWWSYRYVQSLNSYTPIYTDWKETASLGEEWSMLSYAIEALSDEERLDLSLKQRISYSRQIPSKKEALKVLEKALKLENKER